MKNAIGFIVGSQKEKNERIASYLQAAYLYGVDAYAYTISEISNYIENGYINAFKWENGEFKTVKTDIPLYFEMYCSMSKLKKNHTKEYEWLMSNTVCTDDIGLDKYSLQRFMYESELSDNAIITIPFIEYSELLKIIDVIPNAIIKPVGGRKGKGIMKINFADGVIHYSTHDESGILTEKIFEEYKSSTNYQCCFLVEPCINILNNSGRAVDFRCLVSLDGNGEWANVTTYARIGSSSVVSNVSDGGAIGFAESVLEEFVPGHGKEEKEKMDKLALKVAKLVEEKSSNPVSWLGIDICLDRDTNKMYVFEANSKPGMKSGPWPLALMRAQYHKYILANGIKQKKVNENQ